MGSKTAIKARARRTHSLGGCATCRRRHTKCDQVQPFCLTCKAVGVTCEGYSSSVQWVTSSSSNSKVKTKKGDLSTTRRHLYSEQSRASMSSELTANLAANSVDASLTEIDSWSKNTELSSTDILAVGPFGVLNFNAPITTSDSQDAAPAAPLPVGPLPSEVAGIETGEELFPTPSTLDLLMSLDDSLQWADLFALDFGNETLMQQDPFAPIMQDLLPQSQNYGSSIDRYGQIPSWDSTEQTVLNDANINIGTVESGHLHVPVSPFVNKSGPLANLLGDTHMLLRHFQDKVIDAMAGVPWTEKSPWKTLNLANAVQTLADMTFLGEKTVKHARAANLYSLICCSARHLAASTTITSNSPRPGDHWDAIAGWALNKAKTHVKHSMRSEFDGPEKSKYKDQLMATIAVMSACMMSDSQVDARRYMLESERVLRLRGLAKREISRKARMLHHIYTWARIAGESTYVIHDYNSYAPAVQNLNLQHQRRVARTGDGGGTIVANASSIGHNARLDDFLRLDTQHESDLEIDETKEAEKGLHDIHLEDSRDNPASMYLQIYGIPETWLSLVSQTTRLANVMDTLKVSNRETNVAFQNALQKRAGRLENMICSFAFRTASAHPTPVASDNDGIITTHGHPHRHMLQALNSALVIFFYRRVRDVNPWILQSHVDDVTTALQDFDKALAETNMTGPGTAWPAFIAGCEAISSPRREALLKWIQAGRAQCGLNSYTMAEQVMLEVWKRRDETSSGPSPRTGRSTSTTGRASSSAQKLWTWVDVSREKNTWLMLW